MHRVDPRKRKAAIVRVFTYGLTLILTVITTAVLLYIAQGYSVDRKSGQVIRSGLLLVNNKPETAQIYINGVLRDGSAPGRFILPASTYGLSLERDNYRGWKKDITILPSSVEEVYYPLLVPTVLTPHSLLEVGLPQLASQSPNRKVLLLYTPPQQRLQVITLDSKEPKLLTIPLSAAIRRENGNPGHFRLIEWALNNRQVLLEQILPSGTREYISLDITKPEEAINISTLYVNAQAPTNIHYVGEKTEQIYGMSDGVLSVYDLKEAKRTPFLENIRSYEPYGDTIILFARMNTASQNVETGIWQDGTSTVVHTGQIQEGEDLLAYAEYEGHHYFAVAQTGSDAVTLYRDPLKNPILPAQLPYAILPLMHPEKLMFSDGTQFLAALSTGEFSVYDFEHLKDYQFTLPFEVMPGTSKWMDSHHFTTQRADGTAVLFDYDGTNQQALLSGLPAHASMFSENYQYLYRLSEAEGKVTLDVTSMVAGKE